MATKSSREAALERRKALTEGGKQAGNRHSSGGGRVRTAADARPTRTNAAPAQAAAPVASAPAATPAPTRSLSVSAPARSGSAKRVSNPSRDLVLARREALSRGGKRANQSKDRTRTDVARETSKPAPAAAAEHKCKCEETKTETSSRQRESAATLSLSSSRSSASGSSNRPATRKASAQHNPSRALVLARREALSKRGKSASTTSKTGPAAVARQINPDLSARELSQ
ncbi:CsoS2 family carboxysome shell protein, partial [Vulcanococcus sp.]